jgi:hypothetical protein
MGKTVTTSDIFFQIPELICWNKCYWLISLLSFDPAHCRNMAGESNHYEEIMETVTGPRFRLCILTRMVTG